MRTQEAEIAALKRALATMNVAGGAAGAGALADARVPLEFVCPISQHIMTDPVVAADGYTYERAAILAWLRAGHTASPISNRPLAHPGLTPNVGVTAAIAQFQGVRA